MNILILRKSRGGKFFREDGYERWFHFLQYLDFCAIDNEDGSWEIKKNRWTKEIGLKIMANYFEGLKVFNPIEG